LCLGFFSISSHPICSSLQLSSYWPGLNSSQLISQIPHNIHIYTLQEPNPGRSATKVEPSYLDRIYYWISLLVADFTQHRNGSELKILVLTTDSDGYQTETNYTCSYTYSSSFCFFESPFSPFFFFFFSFSIFIALFFSALSSLSFFLLSSPICT